MMCTGFFIVNIIHKPTLAIFVLKVFIISCKIVYNSDFDSNKAKTMPNTKMEKYTIFFPDKHTYWLFHQTPE